MTATASANRRWHRRKPRPIARVAQAPRAFLACNRRAGPARGVLCLGLLCGRARSTRGGAPVRGGSGSTRTGHALSCPMAGRRGRHRQDHERHENRRRICFAVRRWRDAAGHGAPDRRHQHRQCEPDPAIRDPRSGGVFVPDQGCRRIRRSRRGNGADRDDRRDACGRGADPRTGRGAGTGEEADSGDLDRRAAASRSYPRASWP